MNLTPESDLYADLIDYGRHGDIAKWLREKGEENLASCVAAIDTSLSDSSFYDQLKASIIGNNDNPGQLKPSFEKCFSFEGVKCEVKDNEAMVSVSLKVLMCLNETYELSVSSNWGTCAALVNSYNHPKGQIACVIFTLRKRPGNDIGEIIVNADNKVLSQSVIYYSEFLVGDVRFKMIHVDGGTFMMGATHEQGRDAYMDEKPAHQVTLNSFSIGEIPVTQELWQAVMGYNVSFHKGIKRPVENVNWNECQRFISKLNSITGKCFRLPTEAEWEYAARGGSQSRGYKYAGSDNLNSVAWYLYNSGGKTHEVGQKSPNELGLYDMSGNVLEWCQDWFGPYSSSSQTNPIGALLGTCRVSRGGNNCSGTERCRVSMRFMSKPDSLTCYIGLRLALSE